MNAEKVLKFSGTAMAGVLPMSSSTPGVYRFAGCTLDTVRGCVLVGDRLVPLRAQSFRLLGHLVENAGRLVSKDEIIAAIWPNTFVSDDLLTRCVSDIRRALGDQERRIINTVSRRGYILDVPVSTVGTVEASPTLNVGPTGKPCLAVLSFMDLTDASDQRYFSDGMVEEIITAITRLRWLSVIAPNSSFTYRDRAADLRDVARELGVRYVVRGSIRKIRNRVRVSAHLIEPETGAQIWAERYDRDLSDIFALQDEIAQSIVIAIEPTLRAAEIKRAKAKPTESLDAYDLYLRALSELRPLSDASCQRADQLLRRAIDLDPNYADALATLSECILIQANSGKMEDAKAALAESIAYAHRALVEDPESGTVLAAAAHVFTAVGGDFEQALLLAERALVVQPNSAFVRNRCGDVYLFNGECDRAVEHLEAALRLNPRDPCGDDGVRSMMTAHFFSRRFDDSLAWARRMMTVTTVQSIPRRYAAASLAHLGRTDEARAEITALLSAQPNSSLERSRHSPFRHSWMMALYIDGLRMAGLPEV